MPTLIQCLSVPYVLVHQIHLMKAVSFKVHFMKTVPFLIRLVKTVSFKIHY
jgi:hypothetical protein